MRAVIQRKAEPSLLLKSYIAQREAEVRKITLHQLHVTRQRMG